MPPTSIHLFLGMKTTAQTMKLFLRHFVNNCQQILRINADLFSFTREIKKIKLFFSVSQKFFGLYSFQKRSSRYTRHCLWMSDILPFGKFGRPKHFQWLWASFMNKPWKTWFILRGNFSSTAWGRYFLSYNIQIPCEK